jgi:PKD repeat protein
MAVITDPTTINFTSELGTVIPTSVDAIDGVAVVTFNAGQELGQATVFGTNGEITGTVRIEISDLTAPLADFSASPVAGTYPLTVTYTDLSLNDPTGWFWDFGDGTTSKVQHPTHTYLESGVYTVQLTASNALAADTLTKEKYVIVVGTMIKVYLPVVLKP